MGTHRFPFSAFSYIPSALTLQLLFADAAHIIQTCSSGHVTSASQLYSKQSMTGDRNHNQTFGAPISRRAGFELSSTPHGHSSLSWRRSSSSFGKSAAGL